MKYAMMFVGLFLAFGTSAQDSTWIADQIIKLGETFVQNDSWSLEQEIVLLDRKSGEVYDREKTTTWKSGKRQFIEQFSEELLFNDPYLIKVDNEGKRIIVEPYSSKAAVDFPLEEYFKFYKELAYRETESHRVFHLYFKKLYIYQEAEIWVSKNNNLLEKVSLVPKYPMEIKGEDKKVKLDIVYSKIDFNPKGLSSKLKASKYVREQGGELVLSTPYSDYVLINQLN